MSKESRDVGDRLLDRYAADALLRSKLAALEAFSITGRTEMLAQMRDEAHAALDAQMDAIVSAQQALAAHTRKSWGG